MALLDRSYLIVQWLLFMAPLIKWYFKNLKKGMI